MLELSACYKIVLFWKWTIFARRNKSEIWSCTWLEIVVLIWLPGNNWYLYSSFSLQFFVPRTHTCTKFLLLVCAQFHTRSTCNSCYNEIERKLNYWLKFPNQLHVNEGFYLTGLAWFIFNLRFVSGVSGVKTKLQIGWGRWVEGRGVTLLSCFAPYRCVLLRQKQTNLFSEFPSDIILFCSSIFLFLLRIISYQITDFWFMAPYIHSYFLIYFPGSWYISLVPKHDIHP